MDVLCEIYPVEMTAIFASKRIFAAAATGGARTAELPRYGHAGERSLPGNSSTHIKYESY